MRTVSMLAHGTSGPFAHWAAGAVGTLAKLMDAAEPGWRTKKQWATEAAACEYFQQFEEDAQSLTDALQATAR
jgi:hypothetical protein